MERILTTSDRRNSTPSVGQLYRESVSDCLLSVSRVSPLFAESLSGALTRLEMAIEIRRADSYESLMFAVNSRINEQLGTLR